MSDMGKWDDVKLCPHNVEIGLDCERCDRGEGPCLAYQRNVERGVESAGSREALVAAKKAGGSP